MDLNLLPILLAVADEGSFRAPADRLGVTRSAVSQGMRRLEDSLGQQLVARTTRSVRLTEAGERPVGAVRGPVAVIQDALEARDDVPRGRLRLAVTSIAEPFLSGPLLARFAEACPEVIVDVTVTDEELDIVAHGFDAGIRLGEVIERDMIAVSIGGRQREIAVVTSSYLARHGTPAHPRDLLTHRRIGWRPTPTTARWRWEFVENDRPFDVAVRPGVTTNDLRLMLRIALADGGITFGPWDCFQAHIETGALVPLLKPYLPDFPGYLLYYPQRRHMAPKLRTLVTHLRRWRSSPPAAII